MPRLLGVDIPANKPANIALGYIYGIGRSLGEKVFKDLNIDGNVRAKDLTEDELSRLATEIEKKYLVEGGLRRTIIQNINRLKEINCYRGSRHKKSLPVRGQRTRTNARTRKGPRRTVAKKKSVKAMH